MEFKNRSIALPVVLEVIEDEPKWFLSFNGYNPHESEAIELSKDQCFWLLDRITNIVPNCEDKTMGIY